MSKLEELIKEFCPNGVECKSLLELVDIHKGIQFNKKDMAKDGSYPVINGGIAPSGYIENYNEQENTITISQGGASAGYVNWLLTKFWAGAHCYVVKPLNNGILDNRYLFHFIKNNENILKQCQYGAGIPALAKSTIQELQIPLPALPVQREIVRILDSFTLYSAELTAELTARSKQYKFYRDKLLNFSSEIQFFALGDVIVSLNTGLNPRQFFHLNTPDAKNYYVTIRELQNGKIVFTDKTDKINDFALKLCNNRSNLEVGDVLFSGTGTIGTTAIIDKPPLNWNIKEGVYAIKPNKRKINSKFLMYLLQCQSVRDLYLSKAAGGTVQSVPMGEMKKLKIPVPPMEVQERIVKVLDNFDAICSDLGIGLPAEIEKRQKQYEYYREKLLTFDGKYATILTERNGTERNGTERNGTERAGLIRLLQYVYGFAFVELESVLRIRNGKDYKHLGGGDIPVYGSGGIMAQVNTCIYDKPTVLIPRKGSIDKLYYTEKPFWNVDTIFYTEIDENFTIAKYIYYCLQKEHLEDYNTAGGVPSLTQTVLNKIVIPLPSLDKQKEIVAILDKFDSICNDFSAGLPAEMEHRQKQYEYYRDKLLTF